MGAHPISLIESGEYIDDSRYEYLGDHLRERPAPGEELDQTIKDLFNKRDAYRRWGIPHYWLIDPIESACYECLPTIAPCADKLTADRIEIAVSEIFS